MSVTVAGKTDDVADADFSRVRPSNSGSSANAPRHPGAGWFALQGPVLLTLQASFFQTTSHAQSRSPERRREIGSILTVVSFISES